METLTHLIERHGIDVLNHLDRQVAVPVHTGLQRQGDVIVVPRPQRSPAKTPVPSGGIAVVEGELGRNTHTLLVEGTVAFDSPRSDSGQLIGVLTVSDDSTAWLAHPEHAYSGIGPGTYEIRRQREQTGTRARLVAD